jgi:AcrR family transcriptional regulator
MGFDATPTSRIAERAGVPTGLVHGDVTGSLRRLVAALNAWLDASPLLSHLLWREADTHHVVRDALAARFRWMVGEIRAVMHAALPESRGGVDVPSAAKLLALAVSYRHGTAEPEPPLSA